MPFPSVDKSTLYVDIFNSYVEISTIPTIVLIASLKIVISQKISSYIS